MGAYSVTTYTIKGDYDYVAASIETRIETLDTGKTLRYVAILPRGNEFVGVLIYDT